jgi:hypothetical protein
MSLDSHPAAPCPTTGSARLASASPDRLNDAAPCRASRNEWRKAAGALGSWRSRGQRLDLFLTDERGSGYTSRPGLRRSREQAHFTGGVAQPKRPGVEKT